MMPTAELNFVFKDEHVLAVDKPAGIPVQQDPTGDPDLFTILRERLKDPRIGLVHRLDRPVSGVVLFARDATTLAALNAQFQQRSVLKVYRAVVEGLFDRDRTLAGTIEHDARQRKAVVHGTDGTGKDARLAVKALARGDRYSLVEVMPEGGAFHQIRAQLSGAGFPIKGDVKYGARRGEKDRSIALHACSIAFDHPVTGKRITVSAPLPTGPIWKALLALVDT